MLLVWLMCVCVCVRACERMRACMCFGDGGGGVGGVFFISPLGTGALLSSPFDDPRRV